MTLNTFVLILISICCSSIAQIILKTGMSQPYVSFAMERVNYLAMGQAIFLNPWVIGGLALYFSGAIVWLFALMQVEVSVAYPFVGLGFIITMLLGKFVMGDSVTVARAIGTACIVIGVIVISWRG